MNALTIYHPWRTALTGGTFFPDLWLSSLFDGFESEAKLTPRVDVTENEKEFLIKADLPGFEKNEVELEYDDGVLKLTAEHKVEQEEEAETYYLKERRFGSYTRAFRLPENIDSTKIEASMDNGVLKVTLPKLEETKARKIEVQVN